jgi:hypothetical protein
MIEVNHEWKVCRCTACQSVLQDVEAARREGAEEMREKILGLAKKFGVPAMAITVLKGIDLPAPKYK